MHAWLQHAWFLKFALFPFDRSSALSCPLRCSFARTLSRASQCISSHLCITHVSLIFFLIHTPICAHMCAHYFSHCLDGARMFSHPARTHRADLFSHVHSFATRDRDRDATKSSYSFGSLCICLHYTHLFCAAG